MKLRPGPIIQPYVGPLRPLVPSATDSSVKPSPLVGPGEAPDLPSERRVPHVAELAWLSALVYYPLRGLPDWMGAEGFSQVTPVSRWWTGTQAVMGLKNRRAVLAFRGSQSTLDWLLDFFMLPGGSPPRHLGFQCAWWSIRKQVREFLDQHRGEYDAVELCGHSLGGAIAKVAALELAPGFPLSAVVTLGAPRVFWGRGVRGYNGAKTTTGRVLSELTVSYVNGLDLVAMLPPALLGYEHTAGTYDSPTEAGNFWLAEVVERVRARQNAPFHLVPTDLSYPKLLLDAPKPRPWDRDRVLDLMADAYCGLEKWGGALKYVLLRLLVPFALLAAYLWLLCLIASAGSSHRLRLYRQVFFRPSFFQVPVALPVRPFWHQVVGFFGMLPILCLGGYGFVRLAMWTWLFILWVWQVTCDSWRQLN